MAGYVLGRCYPSVRHYLTKLKVSKPVRVWRIECQAAEVMPDGFAVVAREALPPGQYWL